MTKNIKGKNLPIRLMEVCGTHTMAIARYGLKSSFPEGVRMLSGPGCPICVTETADIDRAIMIARRQKVIVATFGDMVRVPGSFSSLEEERAQGAQIKIVYSPVDALSIARENPGFEVIFIGVGFETTSPTIAATVLLAKKEKLENFSVLPLFKTIPKALGALLSNPASRIDGLLLPGHVSAIIGSKPYEFISKEFGIPGVITGFEPQDILCAVGMLVRMIREKNAKIVIEYRRVVKPEGNRTAIELLSKVFQPSDARWRSIGRIAGTGLAFRKEFSNFDALNRFHIKIPAVREPKACLCGSILMGNKSPRECRLFGERCTPIEPVGPCMVSSEGACAAEYKYGSKTRKAPA